jgi:HAD superfamily hydrolase (TIGR01509 family)
MSTDPSSQNPQSIAQPVGPQSDPASDALRPAAPSQSASQSETSGTSPAAAKSAGNTGTSFEPAGSAATSAKPAGSAATSAKPAGSAAPWHSPAASGAIEPVEPAPRLANRPRPVRLENLTAVLFDMGDTLLDFGPLNNRMVFDESARESYDFLVKSGLRVPTFEEYHRKKYWAVRKALIWAKIRRWEFNSSRLLRRLCDKMNLPADDAFVLELAWSSFSPLVTKASIEHDLIPTLRQIRDSGLKLAIVSNTFIAGKVHDKHLDSVGLLEFFPVRIYSSEVGHRKPSREIFRIALEKVGAAAEQSIFIGDLEKVDVYGARRAGMYTVLKRPGEDNGRPHSADYLIRRISDLREILPLKAPATVA